MRKYRYRIIIFGALGETGREAFGDFRIGPNGANTELTGELDQSGLHGVLNRIQALGLELIELTRVAGGPGLNQGAESPGTRGTRQAGGGCGACLTSTSSRPSARTRSSRACRSRWSRSPDKTVMVGSTSTTMSANASRAAGPSEPITLIS